MAEDSHVISGSDSWVCRRTRRGFLSDADLKKYKPGIYIRLFQKTSIFISGSTFTLKAEIKSLKHEPEIEEISWDGQSKHWIITVKPETTNIHELVSNISSFLFACVIMKKKESSRKRRKTVQENKETELESKKRQEEIEKMNASNRETRHERFEKLVKWRSDQAALSKFPYNYPTLWYQAKDEDSSTSCEQCKYDMLNHYGSEEHPFEDKPSSEFLENCVHCRHHFFYNWN